MPAFDDDVWELYDTTKDWTQAENLASATQGNVSNAHMANSSHGSAPV